MFTKNPNVLKGHEGQLVKTLYDIDELPCYKVEDCISKFSKKKDVTINTIVERIPRDQIGIFISSVKNEYIGEENSLVTLLIKEKTYIIIIKDILWMRYLQPYPYGAFLEQDNEDDK